MSVGVCGCMGIEGEDAIGARDMYSFEGRGGNMRRGGCDVD